MSLAGFTELNGGKLKITSRMLHRRGWHENLAEEVTEQPFGPCLGTVNGDHAEAFRPHLLDAVLNHAVRFSKDGWSLLAGFARLALCSHSNPFYRWEVRRILFPQCAVGMVLRVLS
jgi:hypothetical protein